MKRIFLLLMVTFSILLTIDTAYSAPMWCHNRNNLHCHSTANDACIHSGVDISRFPYTQASILGSDGSCGGTQIFIAYSNNSRSCDDGYKLDLDVGACVPEDKCKEGEIKNESTGQCEAASDLCSKHAGTTLTGQYATGCGDGYSFNGCEVKPADSANHGGADNQYYGNWIITGSASPSSCVGDGDGTGDGEGDGEGDGDGEEGGDDGSGGSSGGSGGSGGGSGGSGSGSGNGDGDGDGSGSGGSGSGNGNGDGDGEGEGVGKGACQGEECDFKDPSKEGAKTPDYGDTFTKIRKGIENSPIGQSVNGIRPPSGGTCPAPTISLFNRGYVLDAHCQIFDQVQGTLRASAIAMWALLAVVVFLSS